MPIIPAPAQSADDVKEEDLAQGMVGWASLDSPWAHMLGPSEFRRTMDIIHQIAPKMIFSAHLPAAREKPNTYSSCLREFLTQPFVPPNQTALEQILAQMRSVT